MDKVIRSSRDLGAVIRLVRKQKNLRQLDVARRAAVRQASIADIENAATTPNLNTITKVLSALDLDLVIIPRRTTKFDPMEY